MRRLSKKQIATWSGFVERITAAEEIGREAYDVFLEVLAQAEDAISTAHAAYEASLDASRACASGARQWLDEIEERQAEHFDERSDRWHEGEAACAYAEWQDAIREMRDRMEAYEDSASEDPTIEFDDRREWLTDFCLDLPASPEDM